MCIRDSKATLRLLALTAVGMVSLVCFDYIYPDDQRYTALAGEHAQDEREAYAATGVVYPFFHSAGDYLSSSSSYDERAARQTYNQYTDGVIPPEKKVNLISIQMEAFADLSLYLSLIHIYAQKEYEEQQQQQLQQEQQQGSGGWPFGGFGY